MMWGICPALHEELIGLRRATVMREFHAFDFGNTNVKRIIILTSRQRTEVFLVWAEPGCQSPNSGILEQNGTSDR